MIPRRRPLSIRVTSTWYVWRWDPGYDDYEWLKTAHCQFCGGQPVVGFTADYQIAHVSHVSLVKGCRCPNGDDTTNSCHCVDVCQACFDHFKALEILSR